MPRKAKNKYGLKGVRVENGRVVYRPYIPIHDRHDGIQVDYRGQLSPPIRLGKVGDPDSQIAANYHAAVTTLKHQLAGERNTLHWISKQYQDSRKFKKLKPKSQKAAGYAARILDHPAEVDGEVKTVGDLNITQVKKPMFQAIAERRLQIELDKGRKGTAKINREISYVSAMITWATNFVPGLGIDHNPLIGFNKFEEEGQTRHVTDAEYWQQYEIAAENPENGLCILFELTLALAARGAEALDLKVSDCTEEGIHVHRLKKSKDTLIQWSANPDIPKEDTRLYKAYKKALDRHKKHKILPIDPPLLITRKGDKLGESGLQSAMTRLKKKMNDRGLGETFWTMHLLKHKAITEASWENKRMAGHKSQATINKYDHSVERFKPGI